MDIVATTPEHIETLKTWFPDERSVRQWGGPYFRHPFTDETFLEDMRWPELPARSLTDGPAGLVGFGQYYEREGRCHLARLIIDPSRRGSGMGRYFIGGLMQIGMSDLGCDECSLFVMDWNRAAIHCYRSLHFVPAPCPASAPVVEDMIFMLYKPRTS